MLVVLAGPKADTGVLALGAAFRRRRLGGGRRLRGAFGRLVVLYGARRPAELLFTDELDALARRSDVEVHVTVDRPDESWPGHVGVITSLFGSVTVNSRNTVAVTVGPPDRGVPKGSGRGTGMSFSRVPSVKRQAVCVSQRGLGRRRLKRLRQRIGQRTPGQRGMHFGG